MRVLRAYGLMIALGVILPAGVQGCGDDINAPNGGPDGAVGGGTGGNGGIGGTGGMAGSGGTGGTGGTGGVGGTGGTGGAPGVACGFGANQVVCTPGQLCCLTPLPPACAGTCQGPSLACDGPEDCATATPICCGTLAGAAGGSQCVAMCQNPQQVLCHTKTDCPTSASHCCKLSGLPGAVCRAQVLPQAVCD